MPSPIERTANAHQHGSVAHRTGVRRRLSIAFVLFALVAGGAAALPVSRAEALPCGLPDYYGYTTYCLEAAVNGVLDQTPVGPLRYEASQEESCVESQVSSPNPSTPDPLGTGLCGDFGTGVQTAEGEVTYAGNEEACIQSYTAGGSPNTTGLPICAAVVSGATTAKNALASVEQIVTNAVDSTEAEASCVQSQLANPDPSASDPLGTPICPLVGAAVSATDQTHNVGGGVADGAVTFSGSGIPPLGAPCASTSFNLTGSSVDLTLNTAGTEYAGPVTIVGNGGSSCESQSSGSGSLTLTQVQGTGPTGGSIDCADPATGTTLSGTYLRVGTDITATLTGTCTVNLHSAAVSFAFHGEFVPTSGGGTAPITAATFAGPFVVTPT